MSIKTKRIDLFDKKKFTWSMSNITLSLPTNRITNTNRTLDNVTEVTSSQTGSQSGQPDIDKCRLYY